MGYIYVRTNKVNGKKYVGQTVDLNGRQNNWKCLSCCYGGKAINNARKKYGIDAFDFEILKECEDDELNYWETYYIKELNTQRPYGYNMTEGGDKAMYGYSPSEVTKKKISEALKGEKNGMYGKHHSEESRRKMGEIKKGKHLSEEHKKKISKGHKGITFTEEHKNKIRESQHTKTIFQLDKNTNEIIAEFISIAEAHRQLGISNCHISQCCLGQRKSCGGFKWRYKEESVA